MVVNSSQPQFWCLFMIFLVIDKFSKLPLLSEWVDDGCAVVKVDRRLSAYKPACLQIKPVTPACGGHEADLISGLSYATVILLCARAAAFVATDIFVIM